MTFGQGRLLLACVIAGAVTVLHAVGGLKLADNAIRDFYMRTVDMPASGDIVVVEIDAVSLQRLGQWPWPRGHHARVVGNLLDAGASRVALDISFSSPSDAAQDSRLATAAANAGDRLVLPIFQQLETNPDGRTLMLVDRPLPQLFPDTPLASINVRPDGDGITRQFAVTDRIDNIVVPFMATAMLPAEFELDPTVRAQGTYDIDFGVDPRTIPRLSYADVLLGRFDAADVAGRSVLIGATAIELGDVLAVPRWANMAGPLVIATGFETMRLDRIAPPLDALWFVFALCLASALAPACNGSTRVVGILVPVTVQLAGLAGIGALLYAEWALRLDVAPMVLALIVAQGVQIGRVVSIQARRIAAQNREAERRQALLRSVVATSIDAVVITDRFGVIRLVNPACESVFGYASRDLVGGEANLLISPNDRLAGDLGEMLRGGDVSHLRFPLDVEGRHADGSALALELALATVAGPELGATVGHQDDEDEQFYIYVFHDVSAQRQLEASRRQALEAQIEAERAKADFLATASHELRTPLNHIQGFSSLLTAGVGGTLSDKQSEYVSDIAAASHHLLELVTDILSYAEQAEEDPVGTMQVVAVADLLAAARSQVDELAEERQVHVAVSGNGKGAAVNVERSNFERGLMHVLRNAIQFSPVAGRVTVTAQQAPARNEVKIAIADNGPGMAPEQIDHVLGAFGQVESAHSRSHGGLGIGLSIARVSAERHGGRLAIESVQKQGTIVTFVLPVRELAANAVQTAA